MTSLLTYPAVIQKLEDISQTSIALLKPGAVEATHLSPNNKFVAAVDEQVKRFADAIQLTTEAAYSAHATTEDVLFLTKMIQDPQLKKKNVVNSYVAGTLRLAENSKAKITKALESLRAVRTELIRLQQFVPGVEGYNAELQHNGDQPDPARLPLVSDLEMINAFLDQVSLFIDWWDWVQTETHFPREKKAIEYQLDALRNSTTVAKWKEISGLLTSYNGMIYILEAEHRDFWRRSFESNLKLESTVLAQPSKNVWLKVMSWMWGWVN